MFYYNILYKLLWGQKVIFIIYIYIYMIRVELLWPNGYELQLSLERLQVLILVKAIGG